LVPRRDRRADRFLPWSKGLTRGRLQAHSHGVDLGPLAPGFGRRVFHRGGRIQLAAPALLEEMDALAGALASDVPPALLLIGRRELRSNNSWMHNVPRLVRGKPRCLLFVNPTDAARLGLRDGGRAVMTSRVHRAEVTVRVTDEMREGVVSFPHGYGHAAIKQWQKIAGAQPGESLNDWVDEADVERVAGMSILNGVPIALEAAARPPADLVNG
jgi:anaerobic selenocysteine-containing dehydrogenase